MTYSELRKIAKEFQDDFLCENAPKNALYCTHETGGISGGSCWDDSEPEEYYNDDPMDEFEEFHNVIKKIVPNISLEQIEKMENELVKETSEVEYEYYGNEKWYTVRYVNLKDLYDYLIENKLICN